MAKFSVTHNITKIRRDIKKKIRNFDKLTATEVAKEASRTHKELTADTPRGYTGNTRRAWKIRKISTSPAWYRVYNNEDVMFWLENGTKRRFPRNSPKLFIPQRHSAWRAGGYKKGMKWGKDFIFANSAKGLKPLKLIPKQAQRTAGRLGRVLSKIGKR